MVGNCRVECQIGAAARSIESNVAIGSLLQQVDRRGHVGDGSQVVKTRAAAPPPAQTVADPGRVESQRGNAASRQIAGEQHAATPPPNVGVTTRPQDCDTRPGGCGYERFAQDADEPAIVTKQHRLLDRIAIIHESWLPPGSPVERTRLPLRRPVDIEPLDHAVDGRQARATARRLDHQAAVAHERASDHAGAQVGEMPRDRFIVARAAAPLGHQDARGRSTRQARQVERAELGQRGRCDGESAHFDGAGRWRLGRRPAVGNDRLRAQQQLSAIAGIRTVRGRAPRGG